MHHRLHSGSDRPKASQSQHVESCGTEGGHRYTNRTGAPVFSFLRTIVMNLLRRGGYRSIRQGLRELAYDIKGMLALGGVATAGTRS